MENMRDRLDNLALRSHGALPALEVCEVVNIYPHLAPFEGDGDRNFNVYDLLVRDRIVPHDSPPDSLPMRYRVNLAYPFDYGHLQGTIDPPHIGDMVLVVWYMENKAVILCNLPNLEQVPFCRPNSNAKYQDRARKRCRWQKPFQDVQYTINGPVPGDFVFFPNPRHPDCSKWWEEFGDEMWIFDECLIGDMRPHCDMCDTIDRHFLGGTWLKRFGDLTKSVLYKARDLVFHHRCGTLIEILMDGTLYLENKVEEEARAHMIFSNLATIILHSGNEEHPSARMTLSGWKSPEPGKIIIENLVKNSQIIFETDGSIEMKYSMSSVKVSASGAIILQSPTEINLNAPAIYQNGELIHPLPQDEAAGWVA